MIIRNVGMHSWYADVGISSLALLGRGFTVHKLVLIPLN